jgi:hypothetical protein
MLSQRRIVADCMRANGWIWTTEATPPNTSTPPPAAETPPAAAAAPKSKPPPAAAAPKPSERVKAGSTAAERYFTTPEASALQKVLRATDSTNDPAWRASLADALHRWCESVLMQVPRNTPEQDRWVDSEQDKITQEIKAPEQGRWSEQHSKRLENSVEYARKILRPVLSGCLSLTKELIDLKQASPVAEALLWLRLSMLSKEVVLRPAEIVGLVSPKYCKQWDDYLEQDDYAKRAPTGHDKNDICGWDTVHILIIAHAVIPLLEGNGGQ